jgi:hypothetical protein
MDVVLVTYGSGSVMIPEDAVQTEITPYMWPGHYGEWDTGLQTFTAWALVNSSEWRVTSELRAPPATCLAVGATVSRWRFVRGPQEWFVELRRSSESGPLLLLPKQDQLTHLVRTPVQGSKKDLAVQGQGPVQPPDPVQPPGQVQVPASPTKEQSAVWRIHTRKT